jgi:hypothetical protein
MFGADGVVLEPDDFVLAGDVRRVKVFADEVVAVAVEGTVVTPGGSVVTSVEPGGTVIGWAFAGAPPRLLAMAPTNFLTALTGMLTMPGPT